MMTNQFLIDESLSFILAKKLSELGYIAKSVRDIGMKGFSDEDIVKWAIRIILSL